MAVRKPVGVAGDIEPGKPSESLVSLRLVGPGALAVHSRHFPQPFVCAVGPHPQPDGVGESAHILTRDLATADTSGPLHEKEWRPGHRSAPTRWGASGWSRRASGSSAATRSQSG